MNTQLQKTPIDSMSMCTTVVATLEEVKGVAIKVLDVRKLTDITDYMIVVTGTSDRHIKSIAYRVLECMLEKQCKPLGMEGGESRDWVLVDFVDVVVHIMRDKARKQYDIEGLWDDTFVVAKPSGNTDYTQKSPRVVG